MPNESATVEARPGPQNLSAAELGGMFAGSDFEQGGDVGDESVSGVEQGGPEVRAVSSEAAPAPSDDFEAGAAQEPDAEPSGAQAPDEFLQSLPEEQRKAVEDRLAAAEAAKNEAAERERVLEERLQKLEKGDKPDPAAPADVFGLVRTAEDPQVLQNAAEQARQVRGWARRQLAEDNFEEDVESGERVLKTDDGQSYTRKQVAALQERAEQLLEQEIPQRWQYLQQAAHREKAREEIDRNAMETFPEWKDPQSEGGKWMQAIYNDPTYEPLKRQLPNFRYIVGLLWEGQKAVQGRQKSASGKPALSQAQQPANRAQPQQAPQRRQEPPNLGMDGGQTAMPAGNNGNGRAPAGGNGNLSMEDLKMQLLQESAREA
jgi:hypothetical protein